MDMKAESIQRKQLMDLKKEKNCSVSTNNSEKNLRQHSARKSTNPHKLIQYQECSTDTGKTSNVSSPKRGKERRNTNLEHSDSSNNLGSDESKDKIVLNSKNEERSAKFNTDNCEDGGIENVLKTIQEDLSYVSTNQDHSSREDLEDETIFNINEEIPLQEEEEPPDWEERELSGEDEEDLEENKETNVHQLLPKDCVLISSDEEGFEDDPPAVSCPSTKSVLINDKSSKLSPVCIADRKNSSADPSEIDKISEEEEDQLFEEHLRLESSSESQEGLDHEELDRDNEVFDKHEIPAGLFTSEMDSEKDLSHVEVSQRLGSNTGKRPLEPEHEHKSKKQKLSDSKSKKKDLQADDSSLEKKPQPDNVMEIGLKSAETGIKEKVSLSSNRPKNNVEDVEHHNSSIEDTEDCSTFNKQNDMNSDDRKTEEKTDINLSTKICSEEIKVPTSDETAVDKQKNDMNFVEKVKDIPVVLSGDDKDLEVPKENGENGESSTNNKLVKPEIILTKSMLEQLVSEKILECLTEGSKSEIARLKQKCLSLEKSVERWKKRAQKLQKHMAEMLAERSKFAAMRKGKVATRSVGLYVRMPSGGIASPCDQIKQSGLMQSVSTKHVTTSSNKISEPSTTGKAPLTTQNSVSKGGKTDVGASTLPPVPIQLIANAASSQTTTGTAPRSVHMSANAPSIVKVIDLTREEEEISKSAVSGLKVSASSTVSIVKPSVQSSTSIVHSLPSGGVVTMPIVRNTVPSLVQVIPSGAPLSQSFASSTGTAVRLTRPSSSVLPQAFPQGTKVTYLVPAASTAISVPRPEAAPRLTSAVPFTSPSGVIGNARPPLQTFLVRMASPQPGVVPGLLRPVTTSTVTLRTAVPSQNGSVQTMVVSSPTVLQKTVPETVSYVSSPGKTLSTVNPTFTSGTVVISCVSKHPAPLPGMPASDSKDLPPKPALKASRVMNGIVLSWNMTLNASHPTVATYQLYAYQEGTGPPATSTWKKVGDVKALPLPMACTLTQFVEGHKYHFAVRAVDVHNRIGPFSNPAFIFLSKQPSNTTT
ncbi:uncharacterized protein LOC143224899 isoform X2 [Tachypleus tridentatus]|uniref:uncharacterized protein LOC143224899 isoform X2 n=1 Tax=Tachypleus tridentatus TaxID=6853 RepID=UPI003FD2A056